MNGTETKALGVQKRLTTFAAAIVSLVSEFPQTAQGRHVANQLLRSGTSVASNYAEARSAESRSDFIHKLRIVLKELNETEVWLDLVVMSSWISIEKMKPITAENRELCRIVAKSIQTAGGFAREKMSNTL
jgi:four helix bundle protein